MPWLRRRDAGNHEFDYGYPNLKTLAGEADFPILAANVRYDNAAALGEQTTFTTTDGKKDRHFRPGHP